MHFVYVVGIEIRNLRLGLGPCSHIFSFRMLHLQECGFGLRIFHNEVELGVVRDIGKTMDMRILALSEFETQLVEKRACIIQGHDVLHNIM